MKSVIVYDRQDLRDYRDKWIQSENIVAERDFVQKVRSYIDREGERALLVTGLWGTGKTIGILQGLDDRDALYVCPTQKGSICDREIIEILEQKESKILIIDEYSWIRGAGNRGPLSEYIAGLIKTDVRVIITGTDSAVVQSLPYADLIHRAWEIHSDYFSYDEFLRLRRLPSSRETMERYLTEAGILGLDIRDKPAAARDYIQTAILDNLSAYYKEFGSEQLQLSVYTILYECIRSSNIAPIQSYDSFLEDFGVRTDVPIDPFAFNSITHALERLEIIVRLEDLRRAGVYRTYLTNQALTGVLIQAIYRVPVLDTAHFAYLYESSLVCRAATYAGSDTHLYYLLGRAEREIAFVITQGREGYSFVCSYTDSNQCVIRKESLLVRPVIPNFLARKHIDVYGRYVIYLGEEKLQTVNDYDVFFTHDWSIVTANFRSFDLLVQAYRQALARS